MLCNPVLACRCRHRDGMAGSRRFGISTARGHTDRLVHCGIGGECRHRLARPATLPAGVTLRSAGISLDRDRRGDGRRHSAHSVENLCLSYKAPSPVRNAVGARRKRCRPTPASFSTTASTVVRCCVRLLAIAASSAPMPTFHAHPFKRRGTLAVPRDAASQLNARFGSIPDA